MQKNIREFVEICARTLPINEPIYEFGSRIVGGGIEEADLRPVFHGKVYVGTDMEPGSGVDQVLDLHDLDLPDNSVGTVITLDTIEHVEYVRKAMENIHRVLKPDGLLIISSVLNFPIHNYPYDYWRFTPEGLRSLLKHFTYSHVDSLGLNPKFPNTVFGIALKRMPQDGFQDRFDVEINRQKAIWRQRAESIKKKLTATGNLPES